jgi:homoserine dehydrogenase
VPGVSGGGGDLIVLKFGGSVLTGRDGYQAAVHEIYRWRRKGFRVVAVVSALGGRTDALLALGREVAAGGEGSPWARAALVGNGESESAALLALHLDRAGVPAALLTPGGVGLTGDGDPEDAVPVSLEPEPFRAALAEPGAVVVPGFLGVDGAGRTIHFGRGGSDTTALFLAWALGAARCRLIKDVPGLFERDPAGAGPPPRFYARASWDDALATDGRILQHKAVRLARRWGRPFEVAGLNGIGGTRVGPWPSVLMEPPVPAEPLPVALLGLGTVGGGVVSLLRALPEIFTVVGAAVRSPQRRAGAPFPLTDDPVALAASDAPVVIEAMGGVEPALSAARAALARGAHLVTANKALLAAHGPELRALARETGGSLRASAAVGGSAPVLEAVSRQDPHDLVAVRGILNGTTGFVLSRLEEGVDLEGALAQARGRGYAEQDAGRDLSGLDAAEKLCVIAQSWGVGELSREAVEREPLDAEAPTRLGIGGSAAALGRAIRQVATLEREGGRLRARVTLEALDPSDPLVRLQGVENGAVLQGRDGAALRVRGLGAGRWPTAEAVMADVLDVARERGAARAARGASMPEDGVPPWGRRPGPSGQNGEPFQAVGGTAIDRTEDARRGLRSDRRSPDRPSASP